MTIQEFMRLHENEPKGYCPCVITTDGAVYECPDGHLNALFDLDEGREMLAEIPDNIAPLFYMIQKTGAVAVDYEAQVFSGELTNAEKTSLQTLYEHDYITKNPQNIHGHIYL